MPIPLKITPEFPVDFSRLRTFTQRGKTFRKFTHR
jgi:hypothetical protein